MATTYDEQIQDEIPGEFYVFSLLDAEEDEETNAVISSLDEYELPENVVRGEISGGGVCVHALLNVLKQNGGGKKKKKSSTKTWADALEAMQLDIREERGMDTYTPTLSTSRPTDLWSEPIRIASSSKQGVKRALLIGIHYDDEDDGDDVKLSSCHDDTRKIRKHLIHEEGFEPQNILVMMDDNGRHHEPTKDFILECVTQLCEVSKAGDSIFFHFSGHGGRLLDEEESDEDEIPHELLTLSDYRKGGILTDDELYSSFVREVPAGVHVVAVIDTCHPSPSGCALELPYVCEAGDDEVRDSGGFRSARAIMASVTAAAGAAAVTSKKKKAKKKKVADSDDESEEPESNDQVAEKKVKKKKKVADSDDESEESESNDQVAEKKVKKKKKVADSDDESEESESNDQVAEKKVKKKKKVADSDDESEDFEIDDENDLEESSQSEKDKSAKKPKKKKKKKGEEDEAEEVVVEKDIDESSQSEKGKSEKKVKKKKKKKGEEDVLTKEEEASEEQDEQEKPKKKNKGQKDPPKEEEASEEQEDEEKPKKKKKGDKEDKKKKKSKKPKDPSNSSGGDDIGSQDDEEPPEQAPKKKKKDEAPKKKKKTKKK